METPICPKCGNKTNHEFDDTNKCLSCGLYYDDQGNLLCGVCLLPADRDDGWCSDCHKELVESE